MTTTTGPRSQRTVRSVLARMRAIGAELPPEDGVAVFNRVYLSVTEEVGQRLTDGYFEDRAATEELDARFAGRYLAAIDAAVTGRRPPACWRPLFALRRHAGIRPLQFALAGINAHIGHDLALALVGTCRARKSQPAALHEDFDRVGTLLTGLEKRIRDELMPGPDPLDAADPLTHLVDSWSLAAAREGAWSAFRTLWGLRGLPDLAEDFAERLDANVGLVGRILLTPLP
jgi:hypothetical protein